MADKGKKPIDEPSASYSPEASEKARKSIGLDIIPENAFGTEFIPIIISSDSSDESADEYSVKDAVRYHRELGQTNRECRALHADMNLVEAYACVERERRMALEAHLGYTTERLNCLQEAANSLVRIVDRQGSPSPHHLHAAIDLMKEALKKKEKDAAEKK